MRKLLMVSFLVAALAVPLLTPSLASANPWRNTGQDCDHPSPSATTDDGYLAENLNTGAQKCFKDGAGPAP